MTHLDQCTGGRWPFRAQESRLTQVGEHRQAPLPNIHILQTRDKQRRNMKGAKAGLFYSNTSVKSGKRAFSRYWGRARCSSRLGVVLWRVRQLPTPDGVPAHYKSWSTCNTHGTQ